VFKRFPIMTDKHWYAVTYGPLVVVVLDGNASRLGDKEWTKQRAWYKTLLVEADRNPGVRGVVVMVHQPAFTNSTVTGDEPTIESDVLAPLLQAKKTVAMLSGHVHSYERFARHDGNGEKMLVVSGGGGGPRAELEVGDKRRHPDDLFDGPSVRDFNFAIYEIDEDGIQATVRGLAKGATEVRDIDHFAMKWPD
jgi:hypothetical protein